MSEELDALLAESEAHGDYGPYAVPDELPPIGFEAWAQLSARLSRRDGERQAAILAAEEIDPQLWRACDAFWLRQLAASIGRDEMALADRYAHYCSADMKRRRREPAADVEGTLEISTVIAAAPTPFKPTAAPIRVPSAAAAQAPPHDAAGMTAEVPVTKPRDPTLPFDD